MCTRKHNWLYECLKAYGTHDVSDQLTVACIRGASILHSHHIVVEKQLGGIFGTISD